MADNKQFAKLEFVSFCIEHYKVLTNKKGSEVVQMFLQRGVIDFLLEQEKTKYWWLGSNSLYSEIVSK